jgi:cysteinyl-tRNA synthetase
MNQQAKISLRIIGAKRKTICWWIVCLGLFGWHWGCGGDNNGEDDDRDYRQAMRDFVQAISADARQIHPGFILIPQNGHELLTDDGETTGSPATAYIAAIDGVGREDLFYGYQADDVPTPQAERDYMLAFMDIAENNGVEVLVTDYCWTASKMDDSYEQNFSRGYISFAADHRELDNIPPYPPVPYRVNDSTITTLSEARNFLYLLNPGAYGNKTAFLQALQGTDYDLVIIDLFYDGIEQLTAAEVQSLKTKANGGTRLVIAYMSIGEAEDYRYYWRSEWASDPPSWLAAENPNWPGNYKVRYWDVGWQQLIYGNEDSYLRRIIDAGFDGVYLDIIDAYEYFEGL